MTRLLLAYRERQAKKAAERAAVAAERTREYLAGTGNNDPYGHFTGPHLHFDVDYVRFVSIKD